MKVTEMKRVLYIFLIIAALLLLVVLVIFICLVMLDKLSNEISDRNVEDGRYYRFDLSRNETSVGFTQRFSTEEHIIYDDEGIVHYFSEFGSEYEDVELYECSGSCYCDEDVDERRGAKKSWGRSIWEVVTIIVIYKVATGINSYLDRRLEEKCLDLMDGVCAEAFVRSKLDGCSPVEKQGVVEENDQVEVKKVKRVICKGRCLASKHALSYDKRKELKLKKKLEEECKKLSLTTVFNPETLSNLEDTEFFDEYVKCYEMMTKSAVDRMKKERGIASLTELQFHRMEVIKGCFDVWTNGIYGFFVDHFLVNFCREGEVGERVWNDSSSLQFSTCCAWKGEDGYSKAPGKVHFYWTRKEWRRKNKSLDCVIKMV